MPFINFNDDTNTFLDYEYDVTIVGAGAAGILLAVELSKSGKSVLLIESGHFNIDEEKQKLNEVENVGKILKSVEWGRKRAVGGSTLAWGGQSLPFTNIDFEQKTWVDNSGWPICYSDLSKYYDDANIFMGIDTLNYRDDIFKKIKLENPGFNPALLDFHVSKWAPEPNFQVLYKSYLNKNVTVIYNAHLSKIFKLHQGKVTDIEISNFKKESVVVKINSLIIAAGGIETVRILLNNNIGNPNRVGKCFMEHPCIEIGNIVTKDNFRLQAQFNTHVWKRKTYSVRLSLSEDYQRINKTLNCSASVMFFDNNNGFDPYLEIRNLKNNFKFKTFLKVLGSYKVLAKSMFALVKSGFYYKPNAKNRVVLMIEQEPIFSSSIVLSSVKDLFGIPNAKIDWRISRKTWESALHISQILKNEIERTGLGTLSLHNHISDNEEKWENYMSDVNHHMGGARMSAQKDSGVVDPNLQVWDVPNLYVCSCAVFPTVSHSNPTLTLLALAYRLKDHILNQG